MRHKAFPIRVPSRWGLLLSLGLSVGLMAGLPGAVRAEVRANPRSRSAILRVAQRLASPAGASA